MYWAVHLIMHMQGDQEARSQNVIGCSCYHHTGRKKNNRACGEHGLRPLPSTVFYLAQLKIQGNIHQPPESYDTIELSECSKVGRTLYCLETSTAVS
jgi:hypothetical protein